MIKESSNLGYNGDIREEKSSIGMDMRNSSDIFLKRKDIRSSYIPPNQGYMRSNSDINELFEIPNPV